MPVFIYLDSENLEQMKALSLKIRVLPLGQEIIQQTGSGPNQEKVFQTTKQKELQPIFID
ncbi:hypothetical protein AAE02nite_11460 [Adhaeribacter aerolatus]|uniref:Uncharacterized protein n=1 Tax=Adhaeribacter aerolatus TaxID=670289 RepID=A0A512AUT0_9BACT|nr:hypothetical protein [Adhaeribacter aerolatus]GEO03482.1 hypothetical protein AAE02nite_11460 [Adhaeribacter aerolatus]